MPEPVCTDCGTPLPLRTVNVLTKDCWNCDQYVRVAVGSKETGHIYPQNFTEDELAFAASHGVTLDVRYSNTVRESYLANVCGACDQIQGNWFLCHDPFHDTYRAAVAELQGYEGPCDKCTERNCDLHGTYHTYEAQSECPTCREMAKRTPCGQYDGRECFYPTTCAEQDCYFTRRQEARPREVEERVEKARNTKEATLASIEEEAQPLRLRVKGCTTCGASRSEFRFQDSQAFCSRCGASQGPDHFRA